MKRYIGQEMRKTIENIQRYLDGQKRMILNLRNGLSVIWRAKAEQIGAETRANRD